MWTTFDVMSVATKRTAKNAKQSVSEDEVRRAVRVRYSQLAASQASCCGPDAQQCSCGAIYPQTELVSLPSEAIAVSAGCGNPTAIAALRPGMVVVDFGSGGGIDAFLSAKKVGPKGRVIGIDATHEMILRARKTAKDNGFTNVEFRLGEIEHVPLESDTADVVISNCVINLSPDKEQVFREAFRILKPGGRMAVSDIVLLKDLPERIRGDLVAWSGCVSGAISEREYIGAMERAGFRDVKVEERVVYTHEMMEGYLSGSKAKLKESVPEIDLGDLIASYKISAVKPSRGSRRKGR